MLIEPLICVSEERCQDGIDLGFAGFRGNEHVKPIRFTLYNTASTFRLRKIRKVPRVARVEDNYFASR